MPNNDTPLMVQPFTFHGLDLDYANKRHPKEAIGACPFCEKEDHFYVNRSTGQWDCKRCGEKGNVASFLSTFYNYCLEATTDEDYLALAEERAIPVEYLKADGYVVGQIRGKWLIPVHNAKGKLANLLQWFDDGAFGTPTCNMHLIGLSDAPSIKDAKQIDIVEGPWDRSAWKATLGRLRKKGKRLIQVKSGGQSLLSETLVLAAPGSGTFREEWAKMFKDKPVRVMFDNDHKRKVERTGKEIQPGWEGTKRAASLLVAATDDVEWLKWGPNGQTKKLPSGYDLRDLQRDRGPAKAYLFVVERLEPADIEPADLGTRIEGEDIEPLPRSTFAELCQDFDEVLYFTSTVRDTLIIMLSVIATTTLDGDQLWLRVIGPPGSGKSTLAEAVLAARDYVIAVDILTGLASGFVSKGDASLIDQIRDKTSVIHDADTIINSPNRDSIMRELRAFYGRNLSARYRNNQRKIYHGVNSTWIWCGTDALRDLNKTFLGERFLDCEILGQHDGAEYVQRSRRNTYSQVAAGLNTEELVLAEDIDPADMARLKGATRGYINFVKDGIESKSIHAPRMSPAVDEELEALAEFLSYARARFEQRKEDFDYRPRKS